MGAYVLHTTHAAKTPFIYVYEWNIYIYYECDITNVHKQITIWEMQTLLNGKFA